MATNAGYAVLRWLWSKQLRCGHEIALQLHYWRHEGAGYGGKGGIAGDCVHKEPKRKDSITVKQEHFLWVI